MITLLDDNQQACVDLLTQALDLAQEGKVTSIAMVVCMDSGWATVMAGNRPGDLNLGLDDLKDKILTEVLSGNVKKPKPKSSILRVS